MGERIHRRAHTSFWRQNTCNVRALTFYVLVSLNLNIVLRLLLASGQKWLGQVSLTKWRVPYDVYHTNFMMNPKLFWTDNAPKCKLVPMRKMPENAVGRTERKNSNHAGQNLSLIFTKMLESFEYL